MTSLDTKSVTTSLLQGIETTPILSHNLEMLVKRERHQRLFVDEEGKLAVLERWQDCMRYFFCPSMKRDVKEVITRTIQHVQGNNDSVKELNALFFNTLSPISPQIFDRGAISEDVERVLCPEIDNAGDKFLKTVEKVKFAIKLGVDFENDDEGFNGTYFGRDRCGKRLVVFKPADEEGSLGKAFKWISKIRNAFFACFPKLKSHHNIRRDCADLNEVGASIIDEYLKLNIVPKTELTTFKSKKFQGNSEKRGSCQLFVEGAEMAINQLEMPTFNILFSLKHKARQVFLEWFGENRPEILDQVQLEKLAVLDFLTGNQDCHLSNFMVTEKKQAVAIDHGLSFPTKFSKRWFSLANQYAWKYLKEAKKPFSEDSKKWNVKLQDSENLFQLLEQGMQDGERKGFNEAQKETMQQRIEVLTKVIDQGKSLAYLGSIQTANQCARALQEFNSKEEILPVE